MTSPSSPLVAVVTPYYLEPVATVQRCLDSVRRQSYSSIRHYLVADGSPRPDLMPADEAIRHVVLPVCHADYGDTPRGIGAICAFNEDADVVCFLDADNYYEPEHIASVVEAFRSTGADVVFSERIVMPRGHPHVRVVDPEEGKPGFADTSCISLAASAAFLGPAWAMIPKSLSPICDRVFVSLVQHYGLRCARTGRRTVVYDSCFRHHFRLAGLPDPPEFHDVDVERMRQSYDPAEAHARLRVSITI